ncbi:MAG: glutaredoxin domain-containing protein [Candidatus Nanoarchaeia archaeon]|nr:glutaredoxin domain-containing protein [Candidatus Nanoarchaeia archaeon]
MKIKVYGAKWCPFCVKVEEFLEEKGIEFEKIDVDKDKKSAEYVMKATNQTGIPIIEIIENNKSEFIIGFDQEKLIKRLKIK